MNKKIETIIADLKTAGISCVVTMLIFAAIFSNEPVVSSIRIIVGFFWIFVFPGIFLVNLFPLDVSKGSIEKIILAAIAGSAVVGVVSYYLGLIGFHAKYHSLVLPPVVIAACLAIFLKKK